MNLCFGEFSHALMRFKALNRRINNKFIQLNMPYQNVLSLDQFGRMALFGVAVTDDIEEERLDLIINTREREYIHKSLKEPLLGQPAKQEITKPMLFSDNLEENTAKGIGYIFKLSSFCNLERLKALTISFNPKDGGEYCGHIGLASKMSERELFSLLNGHKGEPYKRKNYDLIFLHGDMEVDEIAHIDAPILTFESIYNQYRYDQGDYTFNFLVQMIESLPLSVQYVMIDGNKYKSAIKRHLLLNFNSIAATRMSKGNKDARELAIYKHKSRNLFVIDYDHFLYGEDADSVLKIIDYIKCHVPIFKVDITYSQLLSYKEKYSLR